MTSTRASVWLAGGVAALAGAALFNHAAARAAEADHPPIGQTVEIDGVTVHYHDTAGPGSPIVLIHGNGSLIEDFISSGLVARLAAAHRVIVFDRPGYGYTERPGDRDWTAEAQATLLAKTARVLGVSRPIVVGHSWGTLVAVAWALDRPDEVSALGLLSGYYFPSLRLDALSLGIAELPLVGRVFTDAWAPMQARIVGPLANRMLFAPAEVTEGYKTGMPFGLMLRPAQVEASADDGAQMPGNAARLAARHGELTLPIAVVWGDGDKLVRQSGQSGQSARLVAALPQATGVELAGVGHMIHHVEPDRVAAAILALA